MRLYQQLQSPYVARRSLISPLACSPSCSPGGPRAPCAHRQPGPAIRIESPSVSTPLAGPLARTTAPGMQRRPRSRDNRHSGSGKDAQAASSTTDTTSTDAGPRPREITSTRPQAEYPTTARPHPREHRLAAAEPITDHDRLPSQRTPPPAHPVTPSRQPATSRHATPAPLPYTAPGNAHERIQRRPVLGGLINEYDRAA